MIICDMCGEHDAETFVLAKGPAEVSVDLCDRCLEVKVWPVIVQMFDNIAQRRVDKTKIDSFDLTTVLKPHVLNNT